MFVCNQPTNLPNNNNINFWCTIFSLAEQSNYGRQNIQWYFSQFVLIRSAISANGLKWADTNRERKRAVEKRTSSTNSYKKWLFFFYWINEHERDARIAVIICCFFIASVHLEKNTISFFCGLLFFFCSSTSTTISHKYFSFCSTELI